MMKLTYEQRGDFKRAVRLNNPTTFAELRSLYRAARSGVQFGRYSGYQG